MAVTERNKEFVKQQYESAKSRAMNSFERRRSEVEKKQEMFEKYHKEMLEVSPHFELVKTPVVEAFPIYVESFPVDKITLDYFNLEIKYSGPIATNMSRGSVMVDVSEHYVNRRGSWRTNNEGYKVRAQIDYEPSPYYKTGRTAAKKIIEYVERRFEDERRVEGIRNLNKQAMNELSKMFPYLYINMISNSTDYNCRFSIENPNNTKVVVTYNYDEEKNTFKFNTVNVEVPKQNNLGNLVNMLGRI
jgi:hypothetical protein